MSTQTGRRFFDNSALACRACGRTSSIFTIGEAGMQGERPTFIFQEETFPTAIACTIDTIVSAQPDDTILRVEHLTGWSNNSIPYASQKDPGYG
jgi:hypothetical protein